MAKPYLKYELKSGVYKWVYYDDDNLAGLALDDLAAHASDHYPGGADELLLDEDNMATDSKDKGASQQSVKKYVDDRVNTLLANLSPAGAEIPSSNGAEKAQQTGMTNFEPYTLAYDKATDETAFWRFIVPPTYQGGNITINIHYKTTVNTNDVVFFAKYLAVAEGETYDGSLSGAETFTADTVPGTAGQKGVASKTISAWTLAVGDEVILFIGRDADNASDDADADILVTMVEVKEV